MYVSPTNVIYFSHVLKILSRLKTNIKSFMKYFGSSISDSFMAYILCSIIMNHSGSTQRQRKVKQIRVRNQYPTKHRI